MNEKRTWIEPEHPLITIQRQCELIGLSRASYYYHAQGESPDNIRLMHLIDELFTAWPFYGVEKMTAQLCRQGHHVNAKRVRRLMRQMGLEAVYPKPKLTQRHPEHQVYPYLFCCSICIVLLYRLTIQKTGDSIGSGYILLLAIT